MPTLFTIFHAGKETTLNGLRQYVVGRRDTEIESLCDKKSLSEKDKNLFNEAMPFAGAGADFFKILIAFTNKIRSIVSLQEFGE